MLRQLTVVLLAVLVGSIAFVSSSTASRLDQPPSIRELAAGGAPAQIPALDDLRAPAAFAAFDPIGKKSLGQLTYEGMTDPRFEQRMQHFLAEHGLDHPKRADLGAQSPLDAARAIINDQPRAGRTVAQWVELAKAENLLALRAAPAADADLVRDVARISELVGAPLTAAQLADVRAQVDAMPAELRAPFAGLVLAVADVYAAQAPVAARVYEQTLDARQATDLLLSDADRETTLANALALVAAENSFRVAMEGIVLPASSTPIFTDPNGLVVVGSTEDDVYERTSIRLDPVLIVDVSGDDVYHTTAGGACTDLTGIVLLQCNGLVVSTVLDLDGDDDYVFTGVSTVAQGGAGLGTVGVLFDAQGDDLYYSLLTRPDNMRGPVFMYTDGGVQGYGLAAVGILLDPLGNDVYEADITARTRDFWDFAQGFGNFGGVGIASDGIGDDDWLAYGFDSGMTGCCFQGLYPGGTGFFGGVGVMTDTGFGNDKYYAWDNATTTDFYAYGFGAFGGTGIFFEDGGDDDYQAAEVASNPFIIPLLNCAFGTASFAGLGVFLEMGGNDNYFGDTVTSVKPTTVPRRPITAVTMNEGFGGPAEGEGLFVDVSGEDGHFMEAHMAGVLAYNGTSGRGMALGGGEGLTGNTFGVYLEMGGNDRYTGASPSRNNAAWPAGIDFEAGSVPTIFLGNEG